LNFLHYSDALVYRSEPLRGMAGALVQGSAGFDP
jgi:hypothetical protein